MVVRFGIVVRSRVSGVVLVLVRCERLVNPALTALFIDRMLICHLQAIIAFAPALMAYMTMTPAAKKGIIGSAVIARQSGRLLDLHFGNIHILPGNFLGR